jgi:hypothetical protein
MVRRGGEPAARRRSKDDGTVERSGRPAASQRRGGPRQARSVSATSMGEGEAPDRELRAAASMVRQVAPRGPRPPPWCDRTAQNSSVLSPKPVHVAIKQ